MRSGPIDEAQIARLQAFLMDGPRRYVEPGSEWAATACDYLAEAAALDYAKLIASGAAPSLSDAGATASLHDILCSATRAAIELLRTVIEGPPDRFADFVARYAEQGGVLGALSELRNAGDLDDELAFTLIATLSDLADLRAARAL